MEVLKLIREQNAPIAVFDSGLGGVSVLKEMVEIMPEEDMYYFGDSANAPYGTKSLEEVRNMTIEHVDDFIEMGCKGDASGFANRRNRACS